MVDPYPGRVMLGPKELMSLLSMDKSTWYEFLEDAGAGFPAPAQVGTTATGKDRRRWWKDEVYSWLRQRPRTTQKEPQEAPKPSGSVRNRPKPSGTVESD
jgi:predicted DNA-binding transcriptional regulator AlpA